MKNPAVLDTKNKKITSFFQQNRKDEEINPGHVSLGNGLKSVEDKTVTVPVKPNQEVSFPRPKHVLFQPDNVILGWEENKPMKEAGMENLGNTCYLNSTLQALFHVPAFANWLTSDSEHRKKCEEEDGPTHVDNCLICAMAKTLFASRNNDAIRPTLIVSKRRVICEGFENGNQEDAHEFLRCLLAKVEDSFLERFSQEKLDPHSRQTTPIHQIFGGYFRSEVTCHNCGNISTSFQHFQDINVDICVATKLDQALDLFFGKEVLEGPNSYQCGSCNKLSTATQSIFIEKPSKVLCIQLKRFTAKSANKKVLKKVEVQKQINVQKYMKIPKEYRYKLIATVTHKGQTLSSGHYTATAETSSGSLCLFDDSTVRTLSSSNLGDSGAYLLFYEHIDGQKECVTATGGEGSNRNSKRTYLSGAEKKKRARLAEFQRASECTQQSKLPFSFHSARQDPVVVPDVRCPVTPAANSPPATMMESSDFEEERASECTPRAQDPSSFLSARQDQIVVPADRCPGTPLANNQCSEQIDQSATKSQETTGTGTREILTSVTAKSAEDPFDCLLLKRLDLSEDEKKVVVRVHPVQPESTPSQPIKLPFDKTRIYFQRDGGDRRLWTSYCHKRKKLFCWVCRAFGKTTGTLSTFQSGWGNDALWRAGACYRIADLHERSDEHADATNAFFRFANDKSIQMSSNANAYTLRQEQVTRRRDIVLRVINIVLFLGRQGIALRGSGNEAAYSIPDTSNHGNFLEMIKCQAAFDPVLAAYVNDVVKKSQARHEKHPNSQGRGALTTFLSKSTVDSLLNVIGSMIQAYIVQRVLDNGGKYSLCIDSTQDVSVKEQTSVVVRYVDENGPMERLLDVIETPETTGEALHDQTVAVLETLGLPLVGGLQGYSLDGASNMSGRLKGLQALLKVTVPGSVYQHCYAHKLNLVMEKSCTCVPEAVTFFDLLRECPVIISESHKRMQLWRDVLHLVFPDEPQSSKRFMVKLSKTRWWAKCKALQRIFTPEKSILPVILVVMLLLSEDPEISSPIRAKTRGFVLSWCSFETLAVGVMFSKVFSLTECASKYLQDKNLDHVQAARITSSLIPSVAAIDVERVFAEAKAVAMSCNEVIEGLNSSEEFVERFGELDVRVSTEAVPRRVPVVPRRSGEGAGDDMRRCVDNQPPEFYLRVKALIPIHDRVMSELKARFEGESEATFKACSFLDPRWFPQIVEEGIPQGALRPLCVLADVDEVEAEHQLIDFARNHHKLSKNIQVDFRAQGTELMEDGESCESEDSCTEDGGKSTEFVKCQSKHHCQGCLRCNYLLLRQYGLFNSAYQAVFKLYKCALTLPCTQISCERCFSKLKIIKNRLRNSTSQVHLRSEMLMSVERDITFKLDPVEVLESFAKTSLERSKLLLY